ncbi:MAG: NUDIX hydrolase [Bacteroidales bacterium]|nr:NUDIX hydrolase [Bacteroidales bacterium]
MPYTYKYPMISLTVDIIVFDISTVEKTVLLIQRDKAPFEGHWAFPGGFVDIDETLEVAAARELHEETGLKNVSLKQFYSFSAIDRDPRHRTVSVVHFGFVDKGNNNVNAGDDARNAKWFSLDNLPDLAFDHNEILQKMIKALK